MKYILYALIISSLILPSPCKSNQLSDSITIGINFENDMSWKQIIEKAKKENKNIFVDCYTTWCVPCKKMEQNVYSLKEVGDFFNEKFVSVKFQMDSTTKDDESIRKQYGDAYEFKTSFSIDAFPTFLFFTPDGKLLYKNIGASDANAFIKTASEAINPEKNYYSFLDEYNRGKRDYPKVALMARAALNLKDTINANKLAKDYVMHLKKTDWFNKNNIEFLSEFTKNSEDLGFKILQKNADTINIVMDNADFSQKVLQSIIYNQYIAGELMKAAQAKKDPDWNTLKLILKNKFGSYYAERVISSAKPTWYRKRKNMKEYAKYLTQYFDTYEFPKTPLFKTEGSLQDLVLNNYAWEIFKFSNNSEELIKALAWSNRAVMMDPSAGWIDTYANVLYKLGKKDLAIQWERIATQLSPKDPDFQQTLNLMRQGVPTWPEQE